MTEEQDKIVRFDEHSHSFNLPDTDFKAEVVASGLKEAGYDAERTLIFRRGDIRRGFSKDIHDIHPEYSHYDLTDYLYLYVNRRSLYDELPEGIFHKNLYQSEKISKEQVLDESRIHREEEFFARRFFKPFEISLDHMLVAFQNKERRIDEMNVHPDFVSIFSGQWPVLELLPTHLAVMLVHMLAYMEQITASLSKTGECMTILCARAYQERRQMRGGSGSLPYSQIGELHSGRRHGSGKQFCRRHLPDAGGNRSPVRPTDGKLLSRRRRQ